MIGFDMLGAESLEDHIIGAAAPDAKPVIAKLSASAKRTARTAAKLARINPRAARKLKLLSAAAVKKGVSLQKKVAKAKANVKDAVLTKPPALRAAHAAALTAPLRSAHVAARATSAAPPLRPASLTAPLRSSVANPKVSVLGAGIVVPLREYYVDLALFLAFANVVDDADAAGAVLLQVQPRIPQLQAIGRTELVNSGNSIIALANALIESAPLPTATEEEVGAWIGDVTQAGTNLIDQAVAWVSQAKIALAVPDAVVTPVEPPVPPTTDTSTTPGGGGTSGGGGGGGGGSDSGAADESGAPPDDSAPPEEGGAADEGAPSEEGGSEDGEPAAEEEGGGEDSSEEQGDDVDDSEVGSGYEHLGGGHGGHGGGGHHGGGHGGHRGGRGFRGGGFNQPMYFGPWYDGGYELEELVAPDEEDLDAVAELVARKLKKKHAHVGCGFDSLGADDELGYAAPETHWYNLATTPSSVQAEKDKVLREGNTLDRDIMSFNSSNPVLPAFKEAWSTFWAGFKKFQGDSSNWWSSTMDQTISYGNQLNDWRARFKQFDGAKTTEPALTAIERRVDPTAFNWKPLVYGVVAVAGLIGGGYGLSKVAAVGNLFRSSKKAGA